MGIALRCGTLNCLVLLSACCPSARETATLPAVLFWRITLQDDSCGKRARRDVPPTLGSNADLSSSSSVSRDSGVAPFEGSCFILRVCANTRIRFRPRFRLGHVRV